MPEIMLTYLRVKIKSLAVEAQIIRREQSLYAKRSATWYGLRMHRVGEVREEARSALLAYGYLRKRDYRTIERTYHVNEGPDAKRIHQLVKKYGQSYPAPELRVIEDWLK